MEPNRANLDTIIIGGGPAGLSAALWCRDLGLDAVLFEAKREIGGQLSWTHNPIENFLGTRVVNGAELSDRFAQHLQAKDVPVRTSATVTSVNLKSLSVALSDGRSYAARSVIIATGVRRRILGIPGEIEFHGSGVLSSGVEAKDEVAGKRVVIVGGGDAAIENALLLGERARSVVVIHRRSEFTARQEFLEKAKSMPEINFVTDHELCSILGERSVTSVEASDLRSGERKIIETDAVLIRVGVVPNTEIFRDQIELDRDGYIVVDPSGRASLPGVFAAGDVSNPLSPTISTAVGAGATAAKAVRALIDTYRRVR